MGYVKIEMDQHPQAILWHIWETSKNAEFFFLKNYPPALQKPFLKIQRGDPLDVEKKNSSNQVFIKAMLWHLCSRFQNGITLRYWKYFFKIFFQKIGKNILENIFDLSNMSKNGLRMVVCLNFDITHLSPPSNYYW